MATPSPNIAPDLDADEVLRRCFSRRMVPEAGPSCSLSNDLVANGKVDTFDWHTLLWYAGQRLVSGSLARRLLAPDRAPFVPEEVREALGTILDANRERNAMLVDACARFVHILSDAGLSPVALKGVGLLAEGRFEEPGERILSDIDLWLPRSSLSHALEALRDAGAEQSENPFLSARRDPGIGYAPLEVGDFRNDPAHSFNHVPPIKLSEYPVHLELHVGISDSRTRFERWLDDAISTNLRPLGDTGLHLPSPVFRLLHNFHHSQLNDAYGEFGLIDWRHLMDAVALLDDEAATETIDEARQIAAGNGEAAEFALHLYLLDNWMGVDVGRTNDGATLDRAARVRIARFEAVRASTRRRRIAQLIKRWKTHARIMTSPRQLRRRFGPVPWRTRVANAGRYWLTCARRARTGGG